MLKDGLCSRESLGGSSKILSLQALRERVVARSTIVILLDLVHAMAVNADQGAQLPRSQLLVPRMIERLCKTSSSLSSRLLRDHLAFNCISESTLSKTGSGGYRVRSRRRSPKVQSGTGGRVPFFAPSTSRRRWANMRFNVINAGSSAGTPEVCSTRRMVLRMACASRFEGPIAIRKV